MSNVIPLHQKPPKVPTPIEIYAIGLATSCPWDAYEWLVSVWQKLGPEDIENLGKLINKNPPPDETVNFCINKMRNRQHG